jgi:hypothetical protein
MSLYYKLDENKNVVPATREDTLQYWSDEDGFRLRMVGDTTIKDTESSMTCRVSTVFLVLNHNHSQIGAPIVFETMTFWEGDLRGHDEDTLQVCERYCTWAEAVSGHRDTCESVTHLMNRIKDTTPESVTIVDCQPKAIGMDAPVRKIEI